MASSVLLASILATTNLVTDVTKAKRTEVSRESHHSLFSIGSGCNVKPSVLAFKPSGKGKDTSQVDLSHS